jgi:D-alanyl-D-alanine carboxypeptidase/D-alanyl-D-alanine-endopeptidase (penicillin-binding protein 4)
MKKSHCTRLLSRLLLVFAAILSPALLRGEDDLDARISKITDAEEFKQSHWGILVTDLESKSTVFELNAEQLFAPASCTKLFSTAAAMEAFGADYRFETPVYARGELNDQGRLKGDLVLVASGDLSLGGRTTPDGHIAFTNFDHTYAGFNATTELTAVDPLAGLNFLARQLALSGLRRVQGEVLIDARLFDRALGSGSGPVHLTPIMVNDNVLDFQIAPTQVGEPARVDWQPRTSAYQLDSQVSTIATGGETDVHWVLVSPGRISIRGQIAADHKPLVLIHEVEDAASFARALFIEALTRAGIAVDATPLGVNRADLLPPRDSYSKLKRLAVLGSPPLSESLRLILKVSHNLHANTLPLLIAAKNGKRTPAAGLEWQHDFLKKAGVEVETISFADGGGGDRGDFVTPRATVQLLSYMAGRPDFAVYRDALPILGVDGTLSTTVPPDSPARGKVRAKTGTLVASNLMNRSALLTSKALAGYAETKSGRKLVFAMFVNNVPLRQARDRDRVAAVLGKLCEVICAD